MLIVGEQEAADNSVSVRKQGEGDKGSMGKEEFALKIKKETEELMS